MGDVTQRTTDRPAPAPRRRTARRARGRFLTAVLGETPTKWMYASCGSVCERNLHRNATRPLVLVLGDEARALEVEEEQLRQHRGHVPAPPDVDAPDHAGRSRTASHAESSATCRECRARNASTLRSDAAYASSAGSSRSGSPASGSSLRRADRRGDGRASMSLDLTGGSSSPPRRPVDDDRRAGAELASEDEVRKRASMSRWIARRSGRAPIAGS